MFIIKTIIITNAMQFQKNFHVNNIKMVHYHEIDVRGGIDVSK